MAERERSHTRPRGAVFVPRAQVMSAADVHRAVTRMAHEIAERNRGLEEVVLVGLQTGGVPLAQRLADTLAEVEGATMPVGTLDVAFYRDDIGLRPVLPEAVTDIGFDLTGPPWCWSTTCCSPGGPSGPRSTPSASTAGPRWSSSP